MLENFPSFRAECGVDTFLPHMQFTVQSDNNATLRAYRGGKVLVELSLEQDRGSLQKLSLRQDRKWGERFKTSPQTGQDV